MKKVLFIIIVLSLVLSFGNVNATGTIVYNIITNPGENLSNSVNINWHSNNEGTFVQYTLATDVNYINKTQVMGTSKLFTAPTGANIVGFENRFVMNASLENLQPNTKYMYRVGKDETFSKNYYFTTAGTDSFSFLHITDPQYGNQSTANLFNDLMTKAYGINPKIAFTFFTGDIVDKGGNEDLWKMFFNASNIPNNIIATTPGNHEYYDAHGSGSYFEDFYMANYNNPKNGAAGYLNTSYYFRYNNALFISINSEAKNFTAQKKWFGEVVVKNNDANFIIVGMHRSMYGSTYASDSIVMRSHWQSIFDMYGVDLVLSGHDHIYARSHNIYNDNISADPTKGTTYIIGGFGGAKTYPGIPNSKYAKLIEYTGVANIITVTDEALTINLIDGTGKTIDTLSSPIKTKRLGTVNPDFSKAEFLDSLIVEPNNKTAAIARWNKNGYGNVVKVEVFQTPINYLMKEVYIYHSQFNKLDITGLSSSLLNQFKIVVTFKDLTTAEKTFEIDNRPPVVIDYTSIDELLALIKIEMDLAVRGIYGGK